MAYKTTRGESFSFSFPSIIPLKLSQNQGDKGPLNGACVLQDIISAREGEGEGKGESKEVVSDRGLEAGVRNTPCLNDLLDLLGICQVERPHACIYAGGVRRR